MAIPKRWSKATKRSKAPEKAGAYELQDKQTGGTAYIGSTTNIKRRLGEHFGNAFTRRKVSGFRFQETNKPEATEKKMLKDYKKKHGRLPRLNDLMPQA